MSRKVREMEYAIREFMTLARMFEYRGERVIYLNIGDPLKYDFETPEHIRKALYKAVEEGYNYYSPSEGIRELREAIAEKERKINGVDIEAEDVIVTQGVSEGIRFISAALLNPGDEVLVPDPCYPQYLLYPRLYDARTVAYNCLEEEGWIPDIDDMRRKISDSTKFIVVINPNNPTGALYDEKRLREVLDLAAEVGIPVVSDEIYDGIVLEGEFKSMAALAKDTIVIGLNGFSKTYLMTGWRIGYLYVKDNLGDFKSQFMDLVIKMARCRLSASTPIQIAAIEALRGGRDHLKNVIEKLKRRRDITLKRLEEMGAFIVTKPKGAFYVFPRIIGSLELSDDREFVEKLVREEKVLVVHGSGFGMLGKRHIRIVTLPPEEVLNEAFDRIDRFIKRHSITAR